MNLFDLIERFPDKESCISHIEQVRWDGHPECPYCESDKVARKKESGKIGRWNCYTCQSSFNVLAGTVFQGTRIPLPKWFLAIALMINAKQNFSSCQLARHLGLPQSSTWIVMQRINTEMTTRKRDRFLQRVIKKADETYVGGKSVRRKNDDGGLPPSTKREKATKKTRVTDETERDLQMLLFGSD